MTVCREEAEYKLEEIRKEFEKDLEEGEAY